MRQREDSAVHYIHSTRFSQGPFFFSGYVSVPEQPLRGPRGGRYFGRTVRTHTRFMTNCSTIRREAHFTHRCIVAAMLFSEWLVGIRSIRSSVLMVAVNQNAHILLTAAGFPYLTVVVMVSLVNYCTRA